MNLVYPPRHKTQPWTSMGLPLGNHLLNVLWRRKRPQQNWVINFFSGKSVDFESMSKGKQQKWGFN